MSQLARPSRCITTAILAGGAASRLDGNDKGLVNLSGRPLIAWTIDALRLAPGQACLIVANRNIAEYQRYAPTIRDAAGEGFAGPLAGVAAALAACATAWLYTLPVDCVRPHPEIVRRLWREARGGNAQAWVAHDGTRRQPLFALYRRELAYLAAQAVAAGDGVHRWQQSIAAREVDMQGIEDAWTNLNTYEDFSAMARRLAADE